jgi:hypothetical protein
MAESERNNYVTPCGDFYVGTTHAFFGNRGPLHENGKVVRPWVNKRWLVCVTDDLGPPETFMAPGHHTELFFFDEATALAAGQRPCFRCRPQAFNQFIELFATLRPLTSPRAPSMDEFLHEDRLNADSSRRLFSATTADLPDGVFIVVNDQAWLIAGGAMHKWAQNGYAEHAPLPTGSVSVLTPAVTVAVIAAGYRPQMDASASV